MVAMNGSVIYDFKKKEYEEIYNINNEIRYQIDEKLKIHNLI